MWEYLLIWVVYEFTRARFKWLYYFLIRYNDRKNNDL